jgi:hypothetical protein
MQESLNYLWKASNRKFYGVSGYYEENGYYPSYLNFYNLSIQIYVFLRIFIFTLFRPWLWAFEMEQFWNLIIQN